MEVNGGGEKCSDAGCICKTDPLGLQVERMLPVREDKVKGICKVLDLSSSADGASL